jgi:sec-independent protein translocase protein TatC
MAPYEAAVQAIPEPLHQALLSQLPGSGVAAAPESLPILQYKSLIEPFFVYLKTALLASLFLSIPVLFWQIWAFLAPGLYDRERRLAVPFVIFTSLFFLMGAAFCRYVVMEPACGVLLAIGARNTEPLIMMQEYFGLMSRFLLVFGVVFELPVFVAFLSILGLLNHTTLIRHWKMAMVSAFILGAMLTPPDPFTQTALALPLFFLYVISIGVSYMFSRGRPLRKFGEVVEAKPVSE